MPNITMTIHTKPLVYRSQSNSIGLSGMAVVTSRADTKVSNINGANPPKFYPSSQGYSNYANLRRVYKSDAGGGENYFASSQVMELKKINAVGKSSFGDNVHGFSHGYIDKSFTNTTLRRVRNGGTVAPPKKSSLDNKFRSGGSAITNVRRDLNRVVRP
jgi:hypothetical protein